MRETTRNGGRQSIPTEGGRGNAGIHPCREPFCAAQVRAKGDDVAKMRSNSNTRKTGCCARTRTSWPTQIIKSQAIRSATCSKACSSARTRASAGPVPITSHESPVRFTRSSAYPQQQRVERAGFLREPRRILLAKESGKSCSGPAGLKPGPAPLTSAVTAIGPPTAPGVGPGTSASRLGSPLPRSRGGWGAPAVRALAGCGFEYLCSSGAVGPARSSELTLPLDSLCESAGNRPT